MDAERALYRTELLERQILKAKTNDARTKYMVIGYFKTIKQLINYQIPMAPINVSEGGRYFDCPRCNERFETEGEWLAGDFTFCPSCGQRFKGEEQCQE